MSADGKSPLPFPQAAPPGVHILGQTFTIDRVSLNPVIMGRCGCGGLDVTVKIDSPEPALCPTCLRGFVVQKFNPATGEVAIGMVLPEEKPQS